MKDGGFHRGMLRCSNVNNNGFCILYTRHVTEMLQKQVDVLGKPDNMLCAGRKDVFSKAATAGMTLQ